MSVRGKALCVAVLVFLMSGCAVRNTSDEVLATSEVNTADGAVHEGQDQSLQTTETTEPIARDTQAVLQSENLISNKETGFDLQLEKGEAFTRLKVHTGSADPLFNVFSLQDPPRIVLDLLGETASVNRSFPVENDLFLKSVRLGNHNDRSRIVFDLTELASNEDKVTHSIDNEANTLLITFVSQDASANIASSERFAAQEAMSSESDQATTEAEKMELADSSAGAENGAAAEPEATAKNAEPIVVQTLQLAKERNTSGQVVVGLSDEAGYELKQTNPSEYVLSIPGATVSQQTTLPQIGLPGVAGIRTVRAVQEGEIAAVRMFVDPGISLKATPRGEKIIITAKKPYSAADARAQLAEEPKAEEEKKTDDAAARTPAAPVRAFEGGKTYSGRLISLDLQDTDIDNALRIIAEVSNLNIIASEDVTGKVTLRLIDVPWDQALDVILRTNGLDKEEEGNVIRIAPVEKLRQERLARHEAAVAQDQLEALEVGYTRVSYARVTDIKEQVETVITERGSVSVDERTNQIIVKDIHRGQMAAQELIKKLDLRTPQVLLETQIVEAGRNVLRDLGFQWNFLYAASPETGNATGFNFPNSIAVGGSAAGILPGVTADGSAAATIPMVQFPAAITAASGSAISALFDSADGSRAVAMRLSALETEGKVKVISRPQVATVNNKQAEIKSVETVRVRLPDSGTSVATGSGANASAGGSSAFEEIDVGIELRVTPQASSDYYVLLDVNAKSSTFGRNQVDNIPSTLEREATSSILVKSGQTFALGGVYRLRDNDGVNGVPFLKDIPFLGVMFRNTVIDKSDEELIFFITPHIVEGSFDPSLM